MTAGGRVAAALRRALTGLAVVAAAVPLASCGARGAALGTTSNACFHAIPAAADAVRHQGKLAGVRLVDARRLHRLPEHQQLGANRVCLVAYSGSYRPADVDHPLDRTEGPYAIVAVSPNGRQVLGTVIVHRLPLEFRHRI